MVIEYSIRRKGKEYIHQEELKFDFNTLTEKAISKSWDRLDKRVKAAHGNAARLERIVKW